MRQGEEMSGGVGDERLVIPLKRSGPTDQTYRMRAAWLSWIWLGLSLAYAVPVTLLVPRLPQNVWLYVPSRYGASYLYVTMPAVIEGIWLIMCLQVLVAAYATGHAIRLGRTSRENLEEPRRSPLARIVIILFIPLFLASFIGAEMILASIPQQVGVDPLSYATAHDSLGLYSNPLSAVINLAGIAIGIAFIVVNRVRSRRRARSLRQVSAKRLDD